MAFGRESKEETFGVNAEPSHAKLAQQIGTLSTKSTGSDSTSFTLEWETPANTTHFEIECIHFHWPENQLTVDRFKKLYRCQSTRCECTITVPRAVMSTVRLRAGLELLNDKWCWGRWNCPSVVVLPCFLHVGNTSDEDQLKRRWLEAERFTQQQCQVGFQAILVPAPKNAEAGSTGIQMLSHLLAAGISSQIQSLDIGYCLGLELGITSLACMLQSAPQYNMKRLAFNNNEAHTAGFVALATALQTRPKQARLALLELEAHYNHAGSAGTVALASALHMGACPNLRKLDITGNQAGSAGLVALSRALQGGACRLLETLDFHDNRAGDAGVIALATALQAQACPKLRSLFMSGSHAGEAGIVALAEALQAGACGDLQDLHINRNQAGASGVAALLRALRCGACPGLLQAHVNANRIPLDGSSDKVTMSDGTQNPYDCMQDLAATLRSGACPKLESLYINENKVGNRGLQILCVSLRAGACSNLGRLNVRRCGVGAAGIEALAQALAARACPLLHCLDICLNEVLDGGLCALARALNDGACPNLKALHVRAIGATQVGVLSLAQAISGSEDFKNLQILHVSWDEAGLAGLQGLLSVINESSCPSLYKLNFRASKKIEMATVPGSELCVQAFTKAGYVVLV